MTVGNAGGIEVRLNGKPIGPIGKSGQVRVVVFTPDNFEVLPLDPPARRPPRRCRSVRVAATTPPPAARPFGACNLRTLK